MKFKNNFKRFFTLDRHHDAGFTLVELIVVIAILAILAGIGVPAYSKYIGSANIAADNQVISIVNTSFIAAAAANEVSVAQLKGSTLAVTEAGVIGELTVSTEQVSAEKAAAIKADFDATFPGGTFKTINSALTSGVNGFEVPGAEGGNGGNGGKFTTIFNGIKDSVTNQIAALNGSTFGEIGSQGLLNKVDSVTGIAADLAANSISFKSMLNGNRSTLAEIMGYDWDDPESKAEFDAYYNNLVAQKAAEINPDDPASAENAAKNEILANMAVLAAAKNTTESSDVLLGQLKEGISSTEIKNMLQGTNGSQDALSKSAMMYAMYTAYANGLPEGTEEEKAAKQTALNNANDVSSFMTAMDTDPGFANYLQNGDGQAKKDLEGYLGALSIINTSAGTEDKSVITDLLLNGYGTTDLSDALNGLLGK